MTRKKRKKGFKNTKIQKKSQKISKNTDSSETTNNNLSSEKNPFLKLKTWWKKRSIFNKGKEFLEEAQYLIKKKDKLGLLEKEIEKINSVIDSWKSAVENKEDLTQIAKNLENLVKVEFKGKRRNPFWRFSRSLIIAALFALFLRAFVFEPFRIPSGSMIPTLQVGDHIYVNKFIYGLRIPFTQHPPKQFVSWSIPDRGDIVVFIEPITNNEDWIKRVIGLPGDHIKYKDRVVFIKKGGKGDWIPLKTKKLDEKCFYMDRNEKLNENWHPGNACEKYSEEIDGKKYIVIYDLNPREYPRNIPNTWIVPEHSVFVMGDNRDNSEDSRFLSKNGQPAPFIPIVNIKGRAEFIWWSPGPHGMRWKRIFSLIK
jgi:signal peptidase I